MPCLPRPRLFVYPRGTRFRIIDVNIPSPLFTTPFFHYSASDVTFFDVAARVFFTCRYSRFIRLSFLDFSNSNFRDSNFRFAAALLDLSIFRAVFRKYCEIIRKRRKSLNNKLCAHKEILIVNRVCCRGSQQSAAISLQASKCDAFGVCQEIHC